MSGKGVAPPCGPPPIRAVVRIPATTGPDPFGEVGEIRQRLRGLRLCRRAWRQERQHDDHQRGEQ
jgi:hypothetical protein